MHRLSHLPPWPPSPGHRESRTRARRRRASRLAHLEASSGNEAAARSILQELIEARSLRVVSAWGIAALHASLGDVDEAFRWLDTAVEERATGLIFLLVHPRLDPIRQDPRYPTLLRRVGLDAV